MPTVQCSTASLAPLGGGRYWNVAAVLEGARQLGWPSIELRLWREWDEGDLASVARRAKDEGFTVNSVHIPPDSEALLSTPGRAHAARELMDQCFEAALAAGARVAVVHAWDLRLPDFSREVLVENLREFSQAAASLGITLSVEGIPGHTEMLPLIEEACPSVSFTFDTRWTALSGSWTLMDRLLKRTSNVHVQTYVDPVSGGVALGRTGGAGFDAEKVVRGLASRGYKGLLTLEPNGVFGAGCDLLRLALLDLQRWLQEIDPSTA